jgi:hypothetical protein
MLIGETDALLLCFLQRQFMNTDQVFEYLYLTFQIGRTWGTRLVEIVDRTPTCGSALDSGSKIYKGMIENRSSHLAIEAILSQPPRLNF